MLEEPAGNRERELGCFRLNEQDGQLFPLEEKERALGNVIDSSK